jgi:hypothetical protein
LLVVTASSRGIHDCYQWGYLMFPVWTGPDVEWNESCIFHVATRETQWWEDLMHS